LSSKVAELPRQQQRSGSVRAPLPPQPLPAPPQSPVEEKKESEPEESKIIDMEIFQQILDLDEEDDSSFSEEMVKDYRDQAAATFKDMEAAIAKRDCAELSSLGHFLKGSSAALGVVKVQKSCEFIQNYGHLRDEKAGGDLTCEDALSRISDVLEKAKEEFKEAEAWLEDWYESGGK